MQKKHSVRSVILSGLKTEISGFKIARAETDTVISGLKTEISGFKIARIETGTEISGLKTEISGLKDQVAAIFQLLPKRKIIMLY